MDILPEAARRLAAAALVRAFLDAQGGDVDAREWLLSDGAGWLEALGVAPSPEVVRVINSGKLPSRAALSRKVAGLRCHGPRAATRGDQDAKAGYALRRGVSELDRAAIRFLKRRGLYAVNTQPM